MKAKEQKEIINQNIMNLRIIICGISIYFSI